MAIKASNGSTWYQLVKTINIDLTNVSLIVKNSQNLSKFNNLVQKCSKIFQRWFKIVQNSRHGILHKPSASINSGQNPSTKVAWFSMFFA